MQRILLLVSSVVLLFVGVSLSYNSLYNPSTLDDGSSTIFFLTLGGTFLLGGLAVGYLGIKSKAYSLHMPPVIKWLLILSCLGLAGIIFLRLLV